MSETFETLMSRRRVAEELGVCPRTICRYEALGLPGFEAVKLNRRTFYKRSAIEAIKTLGLAPSSTAGSAKVA
jgi:hypothetical protein